METTLIPFIKKAYNLQTSLKFTEISPEFN